MSALVSIATLGAGQVFDAAAKNLINEFIHFGDVNLAFSSLRMGDVQAFS